MAADIDGDPLRHSGERLSSPSMADICTIDFCNLLTMSIFLAALKRRSIMSCQEWRKAAEEKRIYAFQNRVAEQNCRCCQREGT